MNPKLHRHAGPSYPSPLSEPAMAMDFAPLQDTTIPSISVPPPGPAPMTVAMPISTAKPRLYTHHLLPDISDASTNAVDAFIDATPVHLLPSPQPHIHSHRPHSRLSLSLGQLTLPETLLAILRRIHDLGFLHGVLGSLIVVVGFVVVMGIVLGAVGWFVRSRWGGRGGGRGGGRRSRRGGNRRHRQRRGRRGICERRNDIVCDTWGEDGHRAENEDLLWSPELSEKDTYASSCSERQAVMRPAWNQYHPNAPSTPTGYCGFFPHSNRMDAAAAIAKSTPTPPPKYRISSSPGLSPPLRSALAIRHGSTGSPRSATMLMTTFKKKTVRWEDDVFVLEKKVVGVPVRKESCAICTRPRVRGGSRGVEDERMEKMLMGHVMQHDEDDSFLRVD